MQTYYFGKLHVRIISEDADLRCKILVVEVNNPDVSYFVDRDDLLAYFPNMWGR